MYAPIMQLETRHTSCWNVPYTILLEISFHHYLRTQLQGASIKSFFHQLHQQVNINTYLTYATTLHHSRESPDLKPFSCTFTIPLAFSAFWTCKSIFFFTTSYINSTYQYIRLPHEVSAIDVGYVNMRDEAPVVLLYEFWCIFCIPTSNCIFGPCCWRWYYV